MNFVVVGSFLFSSDGVTTSLELVDLSSLVSQQDTGRAVCLYL